MVKPLVPPMVDILGPYVSTPQHALARPGRVGDAAGAGFSWLKDCTDDNAEDGTPVTAEFLNNLKAQLLTLFQACGISIDDADQMLAYAVQSGGLNYAVATGTANAWQVDPALAIPAYKAGRVVWIRAPATNSNTAVAVTFGGLAARPLKKADATNPAIGDLVSGRWYPTIDDGTNICVVSSLRSDVLGWALQPMRVVFATPGSTSWTVPAGITQAMFSVWSGGGGGGYGWATGGAGAGGSAGSYFQITLPVTPGWSIGVTVGAAGTAGANGVAPGTGGTSSITVNGTTYTALGGPGGTNSNMNAGANSPSPATMPALGDVVRIGGQGNPGISASGAAPIVAGQGGAGYLGGQGGVGGGGIGGAGQAPGGGGGASAVGQAAGAGARGEIVIQH